MAAKGKTTDGTRARGAAAPAKGRRSKAQTKAKLKDAPSEAAKAGARRPPAAKERRVAVTAAVSSIALIIIALVVWSQWSPPTAPAPAPAQAVAPAPFTPAPSTSEEDLLARIAALESKLAGLGETLSGAQQRITGDAATAAERSATIDSLARRLGSVEAGMAAAAGLAARIAALEKDIEALRRAAPGGAHASRGVVLALGAIELRDAIGRGAPFGAEITALEQAFADDALTMAVLAPLSKWAPGGVPSHDDLARRLERLAPRLLRAAKRPADGGWIEGTWARISALVVIRPTGGDVVGDKPGAVLARAEAKLALGDLDGAVGEVERLSGPAAVASGDWLAAARARLGAKAAIAALSARAADLLGPGARRSAPSAPGDPGQ
jgi:hypothetical protein